MKKFWFRLCFDKEFENKEEAQDWLDDNVLDFDGDINNLIVDIEEEQLKKEMIE